ncbi:MAG TPA: ABC transporter substrate-binding protein [Dehalococcoidia bacterium]|nr:ABC transporter substrate-binding protein [Dehalococcoidia bacterium]
MKQRLYVVMAIVMVLAVGLSSALIGGCAAPPAEAPEAVPPTVPGAPPGVFVDPETGWWPGRVGPLPVDAPEYGVGFLADCSGPIGFWNAPRLMGADACYAWLCSNEYGIAGRRPILDWYDHKSNATEATAGYNKLRQKYPWNHYCGTGEWQMLKPRVDPDQFMAMGCTTASNTVYPVGYLFGIAIYYPDQYCTFLKWLNENWDYAGKGRNPRVAYLTYGSGYGRDFINDQTAALAKELKVDVVDDIPLPFAVADPDSIVAALVKCKADYAYGQGLYASLPPVIKTSYAKGYDIKFCVNTFGIDEAIITLTGPEAAEGRILGINNLVLPTESSEGMDLLKEYWDKHFVKPADRCCPYIQAWAEGFAAKECIETTLQRVGSWDKITSREIRLTLETWNDKNIRGMVTFNYSPTTRGVGKARVVEVRNGKWTPTVDWFDVPISAPPEWRQPIVD